MENTLVPNNSQKAFQKLGVYLELRPCNTIFGIPNNLTIIEKKRLAHPNVLSAPSPLNQRINRTNLVNLSVQVEIVLKP